MTLDEALDQFREEFPLFFAFCKKVQEGECKHAMNDSYFSFDYDIEKGNVCYVYVHIQDNEITTVGEERLRDGYIHWYK